MTKLNYQSFFLLFQSCDMQEVKDGFFVECIDKLLIDDLMEAVTLHNMPNTKDLLQNDQVRDSLRNNVPELADDQGNNDLKSNKEYSWKSKYEKKFDKSKRSADEEMTTCIDLRLTTCIDLR